MRLVCKQNSFFEKQQKIRTLVPNGNGMKQIDDCYDESRYRSAFVIQIMNSGPIAQ